MKLGVQLPNAGGLARDGDAAALVALGDGFGVVLGPVVLGPLVLGPLVCGSFVCGHGFGGYSAASTGSFSPNISAALS